MTNSAAEALSFDFFFLRFFFFFVMVNVATAGEAVDKGLGADVGLGGAAALVPLAGDCSSSDNSFSWEAGEETVTTVSTLMVKTMCVVGRVEESRVS